MWYCLRTLPSALFRGTKANFTYPSILGKTGAILSMGEGRREIEPFLVIKTGLFDRLTNTDGIPDLLGFFRHEG